MLSLLGLVFGFEKGGFENVYRDLLVIIFLYSNYALLPDLKKCFLAGLVWEGK